MLLEATGILNISSRVFFCLFVQSFDFTDKKKLFRCAQCGNPIGIGKFQERNGKPYCSNHAEGNSNINSSAGSNKSYSSSVCIFHTYPTSQNCFLISLIWLGGPICARCKQPLSGQVLALFEKKTISRFYKVSRCHVKLMILFLFCVVEIDSQSIWKPVAIHFIRFESMFKFVLTFLYQFVDGLVGVFRNVWRVVTATDFFKEEKRLWIRVVFHAANNATQKIWQLSLNNVLVGLLIANILTLKWYRRRLVRWNKFPLNKLQKKMWHFSVKDSSMKSECLVWLVKLFLSPTTVCFFRPILLTLWSRQPQFTCSFNKPNYR